MKAETVTPFDLFAKPVRYVVPLFQRPYVWEAAKQWEPLWEDVCRVTEELDHAIAAGTALDKAKKSTAPHFLGAIVLQPVATSSKYLPAREIIDGQQRLTTLQLLLDAAQAVLQQFGVPRHAGLLEKLVANEDAYLAASDDQFKVWPTNLDRAPFRDVMTYAAPVPDESFHHAGSLVVAAHAFFSERVRVWAEEEAEGAKRERRLESLAVVLMDLLQVVEINLEDGDNAQVIFETLNDRGTPLQASDLVKNLLFQEVESAGAPSELLYEQFWKPFDTEPWRHKVAQGRLFRARVDLFLQHWLTFRRLSEVSATEIFTEFKAYTKAGGVEPQAVLADLAGSAQRWDQLDHFDPQSRVGTFVYRQKVMQADSLGPVLLWLFDPDSGVPVAERERVLGAIEGWLVRRMLCRWTSKDYNRFYLELLRHAADHDASLAGQVVEAFLVGQEAESRKVPTDDEVAEALDDLPLYRLLTRSRMRMVLEAVEDHLRTGKTEEPVVRGKLTIEHILPQGWTESQWPLKAGRAADAVATRNRLAHTIGNLTLLTKSLNPALSNSAWSVKKDALIEHSVLKLGARLVKNGKWDDPKIHQRSQWMTRQICTIWPMPGVRLRAAGG